MAQHMREDAGVPDGIMNYTAYTVSQILQRIYGPTHERGCWRPRWNNELYSLYSEPNIAKNIWPNT